MLFALSDSGFSTEATTIDGRWHELLTQAGAKTEPEYHRCFPDDLLRRVSQHARSGVEAVGCRLATPTTSDPIHTALNAAWSQFWRDPEGFVEWERESVARLMP